MKVELPYGPETNNFEVDEKRLLGVFSPEDFPSTMDPKAEIIRSLENPIGVSSLKGVVRRGRTVAITVDDNTRMTPVRQVLPVLLEYFKLRKQDVQFIIALGTHRKMSEAEMARKYGSETVEKYDFENHAYDEHDQLKMVGKLPDGAPVWVNRSFLNADVKIGIGNIIPHNNAGWAAGSKILLPGLAGEETVGWMHYIAAMDKPNALGIIDNATRRIMDRFAEKVGLSFVVNTVLNKNEKIVKVFTGNFVEAHRKGVELAQKIYTVDIPELADITVSSSYPADIEFWQAQKGLFSAELATRKGGGIILLTPCPENISVMHKDWIDYLEYDAATLSNLVKTKNVKDLVAASLALGLVKTMEPYKVCIVSEGISEKTAQRLHYTKMPNLDAAVAHFTKLYSNKSKIVAFTHGGDTFPRPPSNHT